MRGRAVAAMAMGLLAACGGGDSAEQPELESSPSSTVEGGGAADQDGGGPGVATVPTPGPVGPGQPLATGNLQQVNNSGITGAVSVRDAGGQTEMTVNVAGLQQGAEPVLLMVVSGSCDQPGAEVARSQPLSPDNAGITAATDTFPLPVTQALDGRHAVVIKGQNAGPASPPLACSPLPSAQRRQ